ncbi:putative ABC transport system ATP-binding protein [Devosia sp. UYZn731]|uniref:ABC transporter ATP-binding protein n=1 Tax=Devosia sp. UYZn731 TaxID=3156345 RepID=UPI0033913077
MTLVLAASGLYKFYHSGDEETAALRGVDLSLEAGSFTALMGPSGSGKSTLLACLAGLDDPDGGSVSVCGDIISRRPEPHRARLRARSIGMLMQNGNLLEHLSVTDNMRLQQLIAGKDSEKTRIDLLERLGLGHRAHALPSQLSGGESARAGLAVALSPAPALLICDEPTAEVDADAEQDIIGLLLQQSERGVAVLVATHSDLLAKATGTVIRLDDGKIMP